MFKFLQFHGACIDITSNDEPTASSGYALNNNIARLQKHGVSYKSLAHKLLHKTALKARKALDPEATDHIK